MRDDTADWKDTIGQLRPQHAVGLLGQIYFRMAGLQVVHLAIAGITEFLKLYSFLNFP